METASSVAQTPNASPAGESKAQEQARLRRERRNAKILAGGSDRLNKITSLSGRPAPVDSDSAQDPITPPVATQQPVLNNRTHARADDPEEVDITKMFQRPRDDPAMQSQQDILRRMLAGVGPLPQDGFPPETQNPGSEEPLMQMMQQLLGGAGANGGGLGGGLPPGLASMFGGEQQSEPDTNQNYIWRIVHAVFALSLGLYTTTSFTFTGSEFGRNKLTSNAGAPKLFWLFATAELMLQSSRYFLDGGKLPSSGILGGLGQMLPQPYGGYIRIVSRYSIIYTTIMNDAMVIIFILGMMAWWKGLATA